MLTKIFPLLTTYLISSYKTLPQIMPAHLPNGCKQKHVSISDIPRSKALLYCDLWMKGPERKYGIYPLLTLVREFPYPFFKFMCHMRCGLPAGHGPPIECGLQGCAFQFFIGFETKNTTFVMFWCGNKRINWSLNTQIADLFFDQRKS